MDFLHRTKIAFIATIFGLIAVNVSISSAQAAILNVDGTGQLLGANNVDVGGTLFNVVFAEGTCIAIFDGCNENSDFTFNTEASAFEATQALLAQVFVDGPDGLFDTNPELTFGCTDLFRCQARIPYAISGVFVENVQALNHADEISDNAFLLQTFGDPSQDTATLERNTFAVFSPISSLQVPEPGTLALFGLGLLGLGLARRKRTG